MRQPLAGPGRKPDARARKRGNTGRLENALGYRFVHRDLLDQALTHRSAASENGHPFGNERLEFLGDRVLGLVVAEHLLSAHPDEPEGALARRFTALVRREALEQVADRIHLGRFLVLSDAEERGGGRANRGLQANACEALIGALYLDGGLEAAQRFILRHWTPLMRDGGRRRPPRDSKTRLQEWAQARGLALPRYQESAREGPAHDPVFTVQVTLEGYEPAEGSGTSKRAAEQAAATELLGRIADSPGNGGA